MAVSEAIPSSVDLRKYIDTRFYGERPHIRGRSLLVSTVAITAEANHWSVDETAYNYGLSATEVLAALLYYQEYKAEIDRQDADEQKLFDAIYQQYGGFRGKS